MNESMRLSDLSIISGQSTIRSSLPLPRQLRDYSTTNINNTSNINEKSLHEKLNKEKQLYNQHKQIENEAIQLYNDKAKENDDLKSSLNKTIKYYDTIIHEKDQIINKLQDQINSQSNYIKSLDETWNKRILDIQNNHKQQLNSLNNQLINEINIRETNNQKKYEIIYNKKLLNYEKQIKEIESNYNNNMLLLQGSLDESRRELNTLQISYETKEKSLYEELNIKDKKLITIQQQIEKVNDITNLYHKWKKLSSELAALSIHTCASATSLPILPPTVIIGNQEDPMWDINYMNIRKYSLYIKRKALVKLLKFSKKIIELSENPIEIDLIR